MCMYCQRHAFRSGLTALEYRQPPSNIHHLPFMYFRVISVHTDIKVKFVPRCDVEKGIVRVETMPYLRNMRSSLLLLGKEGRNVKYVSRLRLSSRVGPRSTRRPTTCAGRPDKKRKTRSVDRKTSAGRNRTETTAAITSLKVCVYAYKQ